MDTMYEYTFGVGIAHGYEPSEALRTLMALTGIFSIEMTDTQFQTFRQCLKTDGFDLHEISRRQISGWEVCI